MAKKSLLSVVALLLLSSFVFSSALAASAPIKCSDEENDAERLLRLHSELMVTTVTCQYASTGQKLVDAYTAFTQTNLKALHDAEQTMAAYYKKKAKKGDGIAQLDVLRTRLANECGQKIADISAPTYCAQNRDAVLVYASMPVSQVMQNLPERRFCKK